MALYHAVLTVKNGTQFTVCLGALEVGLSRYSELEAAWVGYKAMSDLGAKPIFKLFDWKFAVDLREIIAINGRVEV